MLGIKPNATNLLLRQAINYVAFAVVNNLQIARATAFAPMFNFF